MVLPGYGTITVGSTGAYTFTPVADWNGSVPAIGYSVTDGNAGGSANATLTLTVTPVVDIANDSVSTHAGVPVSIPVLVNDTFENTPVITATTAPGHGTITVNANGTIGYTPGAGYVGPDSFTYTVTSGGVTETATVTINVTNDPVVANPDVNSTPEDTPVTGNVLSNDTDANSDPLTVTQITVGGTVHTIAPGGSTSVVLPGYGSITVGSDGGYTFTPVADWNGTVPSIGYTVTDGHDGGTSSSTLDITVTPVVDIAADSATTHAGVPVTVPVLGNDTFEGTPVITGTTSPGHGTVSVNPDGTLSYTPNAGYVGPDSFTYTVTSGGVTETATVTISVTNDPVVANPDVKITPEDTPVTGNVLDNDTDANGDPITVTQITVGGTVHAIVPGGSVTVDMPGYGSITVGSDGGYTFTPVADWNGTVPSIGYTVTDGHDGGTSSSTLDITVTPVVDIAADSATTYEGLPVTTHVLENDGFDNGDRKVTGVTQGTGGTVSFTPDGSVTYTPGPGFAGVDTYTYTVTSGGVTETATVSVDVKPQDRPAVSTPPTDTEVPVSSPLDGPRGSQSTNALQNSPVVTDPGVYFSGERFGDVYRLPVPLDNVAYVTWQVQASQGERELNDPRGFSQPHAVQHRGVHASPVGALLGMDPAVFVQQAVRSSQGYGELLGDIVDGRLSRLSLGSDGRIATPEWFAPSPDQLVPEVPGDAPQQQPGQPTAQDAAMPDAAWAPRAQAAPVSDAVAPAAMVRAASAPAPSFSEQLRNAGARAPVAVRQALSVPFAS